MDEDFVIRPILASDWDRVRQIYLQGIATGTATFETGTPSWEKWDASHLQQARLAIETGGRVVGWAALSPISARSVYGGVAEISIYIDENQRGKGIGRHLLQALIEQSEALGIWTLQAVIFPENEASLRLHQACGFRVVGRRERIARLHGRWRDTILLERRSAVVGVD